LVTFGTVLLYAFAVYCAIGVSFGLFFVFLGVTRVLEHPSPVSTGARVLLFPASAALWPLILWRWIKAPAHP
jgi:hypothetical protein